MTSTHNRYPPYLQYITYYTHIIKSPIHTPTRTLPLNNPILSHHTRTLNITTTTTPISTITFIGNIYYITHTHTHTIKPQKLRPYYTWNNSAILLQHGDIETNPGPKKNSSRLYTKNIHVDKNQYLILNSLTVKFQYKHLEELFEPHINPNTSNSQNLNKSLFYILRETSQPPLSGTSITPTLNSHTLPPPHTTLSPKHHHIRYNHIPPTIYMTSKRLASPLKTRTRMTCIFFFCINKKHIITQNIITILMVYMTYIISRKTPTHNGHPT